MAKHRAGGGKHADRSRRRLRRLGRSASRATVVSSLLLPMPVAAATPLGSSLAEELLGVSRVPVSGVGDPASTHKMHAADRTRLQAGPAVSLTRLAKSRRARVSASAVAANGIPAAALRAYRTAEATMSVADPSCRIGWELLAGIGRIESDHGRYAGAVLGTDGVSEPAIVGLPLNGVGPVAAITDTDGGRLDGDTRWDRAVGPMQFIPSTWAMVGVDGDGDGTRNPHDLDDAALAAAAYLCVGDADLSTPDGATQAVFSYNHSLDYVAMVLGVARAYATGKVDLPLLTATLSLPTGPGTSVDLSGGRGVPIGASDQMPTDRRDGGDGKPAGNGERADRADRAEDRAEDRGQDDGGHDRGNRPTDPTDPADRRGGGSERTDGDDERGNTGDRPNGNDTDEADDSAGGPTKGTGPRGGETEGDGGEDTSRGDGDADDVDNGGTDGGNGGGGDADSTNGGDGSTGDDGDDAGEEQTEDLVAEGSLAHCEDDETALCLVSESGSTIAVLPYAPADYEEWIADETPVVVVYDLGDDGVTWENIEEPEAKLD